MASDKQHWDNIYTHKNANEVSWTQAYPTIAMQFINEINLPKNAKIIDIGGGEGFWVDALLEAGFTNITVLDISEAAIAKAKMRLADKGAAIRWIVADITAFETEEQYDFWHDRAVFHFLTEEGKKDAYKRTLNAAVGEGNYFLLGTFSPKGPIKCSGLEIVQYSGAEMEAMFEDTFTMIKNYEQEHLTPFDTIQHFQFGGFKKIK